MRWWDFTASTAGAVEDRSITGTEEGCSQSSLRLPFRERPAALEQGLWAPGDRGQRPWVQVEIHKRSGPQGANKSLCESDAHMDVELRCVSQWVTSDIRLCHQEG